MSELLQAKFGESIQQLIQCADGQQEAIVHAASILTDSLLNQHRIFCADRTSVNLGKHFVELLSVSEQSLRPSLPAIYVDDLHKRNGIDTITQRLNGLMQSGDSLVMFLDELDNDCDNVINTMSELHVNTIVISPQSSQHANENIVISGTTLQQLEQGLVITHQLCALIENQLFGTT